FPVEPAFVSYRFLGPRPLASLNPPASALREPVLPWPPFPLHPGQAVRYVPSHEGWRPLRALLRRSPVLPPAGQFVRDVFSPSWREPPAASPRCDSPVHVSLWHGALAAPPPRSAPLVLVTWPLEAACLVVTLAPPELTPRPPRPDPG